MCIYMILAQKKYKIIQLHLKCNEEGLISIMLPFNTVLLASMASENVLDLLYEHAKQV